MSTGGRVRYTVHLGLVVLEVASVEDREGGERWCGICVRDRWYSWTEGKLLISNNLFEHEVVDDTKYYRAVLLLWFCHPAVPKGHRKNALEYVTGRKG